MAKFIIEVDDNIIREKIEELNDNEKLNELVKEGGERIAKWIAWLEKQGNKRADVEQAMKEVEAKAKAFTKAHKGESADEILAEMRGEGWIEEDERMRQYVVNDLRLVKELVNDPNYAVNVEKVEEEINWLKSLRPQNTWKPSDEQMENLSRAFNGATYQVSLLRDLYLDLKKLREE